MGRAERASAAGTKQKRATGSHRWPASGPVRDRTLTVPTYTRIGSESNHRIEKRNMNPILIFVALVAFLAPGAVAQLPYDGQEFHNGTGLTLPSNSLPRAQRFLAANGATFEASVPKFNPIGPNGQRRYLVSAEVALMLSVSQLSSVTNTSPAVWGWGEWSQGVAFFGALGANRPLGDDPNHSTTPHFGGGSTIMGTCAWDSLDVGETKVFQSDPLLVATLTDWVGPTERAWQGVGWQPITITLADVSQASGFYTGHGQSQATMDLRLARPNLPFEVRVFYRWTNEPPSYYFSMQPWGDTEVPLRYRVVESPWADTPTWNPLASESTPLWLEGRDVNPSRVLRAVFESYETSSVSFGIEHLGQGPATCAGTAVVRSTIDIAGETLPTYEITRNIGGGGPSTQSLLSYDGNTDWLGQSGILSLPTSISSNWGGLRIIHDPPSVALPLVPATFAVDPVVSGLFPQSQFTLAWGGTTDQKIRGRIVTIEAP